jgi:MFS family permease
VEIAEVTRVMGVSEEPGDDRGKWLALTAALLGWMFDGAEMGVFPLVGRPALEDLLGDAGKDKAGLWFSVVMAGFLVGAATGGVLFGWLGDRFGRVRAMTLSVLTYALFTGLCGLTTSALQLAAVRFVAALGMGGEWSLGVALVMEVWPNRSRAFMAALLGAAGNCGYLLAGLVGLGLMHILADAERVLAALGLAEDWVAWLIAKQGWRLLMLLGALPALLTFFIRLCVPESRRWQEQRDQGATSGWATRDLLAVLVGLLGPVLFIYLWAWDETKLATVYVVPHSLALRLAGTLLGLGVALVGYLYPVLRYCQRQVRGDPIYRVGTTSAGTIRLMLLAACLSGIPLLGTWGSTQWAPSWAYGLADGQFNAKEYTTIWLAVGAIVGTMVAAFAGDWLGRRPAYCLLCVTSLLSIWLLFQGNTAYGGAFLPSAFLAGLCTASFYGWLPLYLPELFATNVRATGQGFSYNFGRMLAAVGVLQTGNLMGLFSANVQFLGRTWQGGYPLACSVMGLIYLVGIGIIWLAPETRGRPLPD